ncbi:MAG: DUF3035 domain-containing protein [Alphaproteobacteria bacterium]
MRKLPIISLTLLSGSLLLSGCEQTKQALGMERNRPDEFTVMNQEPLTMPPSYGALPTPRPGAARPNVLSARARAQQVLLESTHAHTIDVTDKSAAEAAVLEKAGAFNRDRNIRSKLQQETRTEKESSASFIKELINFEGDKNKEALDAHEEYERLTGMQQPGDE